MTASLKVRIYITKYNGQRNYPYEDRAAFPVLGQAQKWKLRSFPVLGLPKSGNCGRVFSFGLFPLLGLHRHKALWLIMICHCGRNRKISRTQDWSKNGTKFQILFYVSHRAGIRKLILTFRPTASACQKSVMIVLSHSPPQMRLIV